MTAPAIVAIVHESERKLNWKGLCEAEKWNNSNENKTCLIQVSKLRKGRFAKPLIKSLSNKVMKYHSGGVQMIDKIECRLTGLPKPKPKTTEKANPSESHARTQYNERNQAQRTQCESAADDIQTIRINGIESPSDSLKVKKSYKLKCKEMFLKI